MLQSVRLARGQLCRPRALSHLPKRLSLSFRPLSSARSLNGDPEGSYSHLRKALEVLELEQTSPPPSAPLERGPDEGVARPSLIAVESSAWCTHPSMSFGDSKSLFEVPETVKADNYERFEFAGDRVIGWVVAELLIERYPRLAQGASSILLARLVCEARLASIARQYGLHRRLVVKMASQAQMIERPRIQCEIFEAYVGVLHGEKGFAVAREWLREVFDPLVEAEYATLKQKYESISISQDQRKEAYVTAMEFNTLCQVRRLSPTFEFEDGPTNREVFRCTLTVESNQTPGQGSNKKRARVDATVKMAALYADKDASA